MNVWAWLQRSDKTYNSCTRHQWGPQVSLDGASSRAGEVKKGMQLAWCGRRVEDRHS